MTKEKLLFDGTPEVLNESKDVFIQGLRMAPIEIRVLVARIILNLCWKMFLRIAITCKPTGLLYKKQGGREGT